MYANAWGTASRLSAIEGVDGASKIYRWKAVIHIEDIEEDEFVVIRAMASVEVL